MTPTKEKMIKWLKAGKMPSWNRWRRMTGYKHINLSGAYLSGANLSWADLTRANLAEAALTRAALTRADLTGANLDFAAWPLWCGSIGVKIDSGIAKQLVYHAIVNMPEEDQAAFLANPIEYANKFHKIEDGRVDKIPWRKK